MPRILEFECLKSFNNKSLESTEAEGTEFVQTWNLDFWGVGVRWEETGSQVVL